METIRADSVPDSPGAHRSAEESTTTASEIGGGERLLTMVDESAAMPGAAVRATRSSKAEAGAANAMLESGAERPVVPEEQAALPKMLEGMVGRTMRPPSP